MCKVCERSEDLNGVKILIEDDNYILEIPDGIRVTSINYCPICGRRLSKFESPDISDWELSDQKDNFEEYCRVKYGQMPKGALWEGAFINIIQEDIDKGSHKILGDLPHWTKLEFPERLGRTYRVKWNGESTTAVLEGLVVSYEDYYYKMKVVGTDTYIYESCVGKLIEA